MKKVRKRIGILGGGYSAEYEVSMNSAHQVFGEIDPEKYDCLVIEMTRKGWYVILPDGEKKEINRGDFTYTDRDQIKGFDALFNAIHGHPGENGILSAYFDLIGLPVTGSSTFSASLSFNKFACNNLLRPYGIDVARSVIFHDGDVINENEIIAQVGLPCFVKPNSGGSSCGISKVMSKAEIPAAIHLALKEDQSVLIEQYIAGRELECGIIINESDTICLPITEIVTNNEFFDYEAKYTPGVADEITPAEIAQHIVDDCHSTTKRIASILECAGLVRADFIYDGRKLWFLEMNTVPGMTGVSIVPQQIRAMGKTPGAIYEALLADILEE